MNTENIQQATDDEWISASDAYDMVGGYNNNAEIKICKRAHAGLIAARAELFIAGHSNKGKDQNISASFWWAEGNSAITQDWRSGDFQTWINDAQYRAFGVTFRKVDIEKIAKPVVAAKDQMPKTNKGGRPPADFWDDLWIEIARQLYEGQLIPKRQADISKAMQEWLGQHGKEAADSTIKERARKLWAVIKKDEN